MTPEWIVEAEGGRISSVVEVVRCKDCAIRYDSCPMVIRVPGYVQFFTEDDDYCSRGKKQEESNVRESIDE